MSRIRTPEFWQSFLDPTVEPPGDIIPGRFGYRRCHADEYHAFPAVNASLLKQRTDAEMFASLTADDRSTDAMTIGTLVHMVVLEPETSWTEKFQIAEIPINKTTGMPYGKESQRGKAAWELAQAEHPGKIIVTPETLREYMEICAELQLALKVNQDAMSELTDFEAEVSGFMFHPKWQVWVKWRPDILPSHCKHLADVKTSSRHVGDFKKDCWQWDYFTQAAFYAHCHELQMSKLNLRMTKFPFIAMSKTDGARPAMCRVYDVPMDPELCDGIAFANKKLGLPDGFSKVDRFTSCLRDYIAAGCPTTWREIRACWPAYEFEASETGRQVLV